MVLDIQSLKDVLCEAHRKMGTIGVIRRSARLGSSDNIGELLHIMFGQPVTGGLRRRGLQIVEITVLFLVISRRSRI